MESGHKGTPQTLFCYEGTVMRLMDLGASAGVRDPPPPQRGGSIRMAAHCWRRGVTPSGPPSPQTKVTIVGKKDIYH